MWLFFFKIKQVIMKIFLLLLVFGTLHADISMEEFDQACSEMKWIQEGCHELPQSHSEILLPDEHILLIGEDAIRYRNLIDCIAMDDSIEGVVFSNYEPYDSVILKSYHEEGYISSDDWREMQPQALMEAIKLNTEEANRQRLDLGLEERVEVIGWLKEPTRDSQTNTIYWAIEAAQGQERIVNSVALKLGRYGYEEFTWITPISCYRPDGGELELILKSHKFKPGDRYEDHAQGDKVAAYGIAGLVAAVTGAKVVQALGFGGLLLLIKKFASVVIAACVGIFYSVLRFFRRRREQRT